MVSLQQAAQDIRYLWGDDAERICKKNAEEAASRGEFDVAIGWRKIHQEITQSAEQS
jgi:hypothetical protein